MAVQRINQNLNPNIQRHTQSLQNRIEFDKVLQEAQNQVKLKISNHASERLRDRNISLNEGDLNKLSDAVEKIRSKGGKEALIFYNNVAFITSVRNSTIITAVDSSNIKENVFTNIDSALIL